MKRKNIKKIISLLFTLGGVITVPAILTSCSSISSDLLKELVSKENGLNLSTGTSLRDLVKYSLTTNTGNKKWLTQLVNQSIYNWYESLSSSGSESTDKAGYSRILKEETKTIKDDWKSTYKSSQKSESNNFLLKFQQDTLDPNGGTEESWKKQKWLDWASSTFFTDLFKNLYVSVVDTNGNYVVPTTNVLQEALNTDSTSQKYKFAFSSKALNKNVDTYVANEYANFQKFIFDQWVQSENPFLISYVQWTYSVPTDGLDSVYDKDALGMSATSTTTSASYTFPYFSNRLTNESTNSSSKFKDFISEASKGFTDDGTNSSSLGLVNLNKYKNSDDSTTSYKLVINTTATTDLKAPLALGSTYLFGTSFTPTTKSTSTSTSNDTSSQATSTGINYTERSKLTKTATTTSTGLLDPITSNFIVTKTDSLKNSTLSSTGTTTSATTHIPYSQIADSLVKKILSSNAYSNLTASGSSNGYSNTNGLYAIDAFIPSNAGLNNVLFLRDSSGVYAIALDGEAYISQATSLSDAKTRAGNVVLYRYLENKMNSSNGLSIDLSSSLSTFFTSNRDWLIYKYANTQTSQKLFDFSFLSSSAKNVLNDLSNYLYILDRYQRVESYQEAIYSDKNTYSSNYGSKTVLNGFAAQYPYSFIDSSSTSGSATIGYYTQLSTLKLYNPFGDSDTITNNYFTTDPYDTTNGIYKKLNEDISTYVDSLSIGALTSTFAGFKYSEYILTDDFFLNQAIIAVGNDGNLLSDLIKKNILISSIKEKHSDALQSTDYMNYDSYLIKKYSSTASSTSGSSEDVQEYINSALSNYFFNSTFSSSTNKWVRLKQSVNTDYSGKDKSTYPTISYSDLDTYRRNMWVNSNLTYTSSSADNYVTFLTTLIALDYLMDNNGQNFLSQLSSKLSDSDSKLSFLVWESSYDGNLDTSTGIAIASANSSTTKYMSDATKLLYGDTTNKDYVITNIGNSQSSSYYPSKSNTNTYVDQNNNNSAFIDSTTSSNYYTHVADLKSFQGIQTNTSSSNISSLLSTSLFTSPTTYNTSKTGLLYGYASSRSDLEKQIENYSTSQVLSFASTLGKLFGIDTSNITSVSSLKTLISDSSKIPDAAFTSRNGYINSGEFYKDTNDKVNNVNYGSYVIQLSSSNLSSTKDFMTYLQSAFNTNDPSSKTSSSSTTNSNAEKQAKSVFWNLAVQLATDSSIQSTAISNLLTSSKKVTVYDVRLNNQLGSRWALNYKDQS